MILNGIFDKTRFRGLLERLRVTPFSAPSPEHVTVNLEACDSSQELPKHPNPFSEQFLVDC